MTGDDEDDANRTMVVPRPAGGLRLPSPPPGEPQKGAAGEPVPGAADRHSTTVPGRLPGRGPATPPPPGPVAQNRPAPVMPGPPAGPPHSDNFQPGTFQPGTFQPGDGGPGRPPSLGTDLFAMQSPAGPDAKTQVRVLVTMGIALFGVLVLILLGVFIFAK